VSDVTEATIEQVRIRLDWSAAQQAQPLHANQAVAQVGSPGSDGAPDGIYITFGSAPAPVLMQGDEASHKAEIEKLVAAGVVVNVLGQFHITRQMLDDVIKILQETAEKYDTADKQAAQARPEARKADQP
jgi:hypothetical protein